MEKGERGTREMMLGLGLSITPCCTNAQLLDPANSTPNSQGFVTGPDGVTVLCDAGANCGMISPGVSSPSDNSWVGPVFGLAVAGIIILTMKGF